MGVINQLIYMYIESICIEPCNWEVSTVMLLRGAQGGAEKETHRTGASAARAQGGRVAHGVGQNGRNIMGKSWDNPL